MFGVASASHGAVRTDEADGTESSIVFTSLVYTV